MEHSVTVSVHPAGIVMLSGEFGRKFKPKSFQAYQNVEMGVSPVLFSVTVWWNVSTVPVSVETSALACVSARAVAAANIIPTMTEHVANRMQVLRTRSKVLRFPTVHTNARPMAPAIMRSMSKEFF